MNSFEETFFWFGENFTTNRNFYTSFLTLYTILWNLAEAGFTLVEVFQQFLAPMISCYAMREYIHLEQVVFWG